MMDAVESVKETLIKRGHRDVCMVKGCNDDDATPINLLALDPIDHDDTWLALCDGHLEWAHERNEFANEIREELRKESQRIGKENIERVKELAEPDRETSEAILMGEYDSVEAARRAGE